MACLEPRTADLHQNVRATRISKIHIQHGGRDIMTFKYKTTLDGDNFAWPASESIRVQGAKKTWETRWAHLALSGSQASGGPRERTELDSSLA